MDFNSAHRTNLLPFRLYFFINNFFSYIVPEKTETRLSLRKIYKNISKEPKDADNNFCHVFGSIERDTAANTKMREPFNLHRRSQDFLWGCTIFLKKLMTFLVTALNTHAKTAKLTTPSL